MMKCEDGLQSMFEIFPTKKFFRIGYYIKISPIDEGNLTENIGQTLVWSVKLFATTSVARVRPYFLMTEFLCPGFMHIVTVGNSMLSTG